MSADWSPAGNRFSAVLEASRAERARRQAQGARDRFTDLERAAMVEFDRDLDETEGERKKRLIAERKAARR